MNKEVILKKLEMFGFEIEEITDYGYIFKHEGVSMLYIPDEDEECIRFAVPNIFEVTEENRAFVHEVVNDTNLCIKYSKVCVCDDWVWVFYEYHVLGECDTTDLIEHSLLLLCATMTLFFRKVEGEDIDDLGDNNE